MRLKDFMSEPIICCTPWDTVRTAATLMKTHAIGALPVVSDISDPLLEGIVTDRDLCCGVLASANASDAVQVADVMTAIPVTCCPDSTLEECQEQMRENQVRRIPIVNEWGRCIGIVSQADVARHAPAEELAATIREISEPPKHRRVLQFNKEHFYCGQLHELDQIALLNRRREQKRFEEVLT